MLTKEANNQTDYQSHNAMAKGPFFTGHWSQLRSSARHTVSNQQAQLKKLRLVNPTENAERHTFKAPCCCFENALYTELTIVYIINVSFDCNKNEVSNLRHFTLN